MAKQKKQKSELKERVTEFSALGYLASIFFAQESDDQALDTLNQMALMLEKDREIAKALDPFIERACEKLGCTLLTLAMDNEDMH